MYVSRIMGMVQEEEEEEEEGRRDRDRDREPKIFPTRLSPVLSLVYSFNGISTPMRVI